MPCHDECVWMGIDCGGGSGVVWLAHVVHWSGVVSLLKHDDVG